MPSRYEGPYKGASHAGETVQVVCTGDAERLLLPRVQ